MNNKIYATFLCLSMFATSFAYAAENYSFQNTQTNNNTYIQQPLQYPQNNLLQGNVVRVPAGTEIKTMLTSPITSAYASIGQSISLALNSDFYYDNKLIAPAGSTIYGSVIESSRAKRGGINGKLCVRFTQISTPFGTQIPISAVIKTNDSTGVLVGGTKLDVAKEYTKDLAAGSAAGALSGLVFGALAGGDVGRGAALGTAVGAGGGLIKSVWDKGSDVEIPTNAIIDIVLTQPITVNASSYYYENQ